MPKATTIYSPETIGSIMSSKVPTCRLSDSRTTILEVLSKGEWDSVHQIYVIDQENKLRGIIDIAVLLQADVKVDIQKIMQPTETFLHPDADQETAVFQAVKNDIIDIMHEEHVEDALLTAGIRAGSNIVKLATERTSLIVRSRAPWLVFGLLVGLVLGLIVGMLGGIGAMLIASSTKIGIVVALALFVASTMAAVIAALIPIIFKRLGKDPALGSGPLATALQDVISILVYFIFATALI